MTVVAVSAGIVTAAASAAIVKAAGSVAAAIVARAVPVKKSKRRKRSKENGRSWCTPSVFPPPHDLSVHGSERSEDRLQGFQALDALRVGARQDRAEPHHGGLRKEATRTRPRYQARAFPRPASLRHSLRHSGRRPRVQAPPISFFIR